MPRFIILGAGVAGLCFAMQLRRAGQRDFVILDKAERLGGTWRDNVYPGSGCDIPSHLYCFSFELNPDWTRKYAVQPEILAYLERCAEKYQLGPQLRLGVEVGGARWDEERRRWVVTSRAGEVFEGDFLIAATGQLNRPHVPAIAGSESFRGKHFHSARWDASCQLSGARVAVIGSGASAVQIVPEIAPRTRALTLFQRSPNWVVAKPDRPYHPLERWFFRKAPALMRAHRYSTYWRLEGRFAAFVKDSLANRIGQRLAERELRQLEPGLRAKLTPDYPLGCKRVLISNDWFPALRLPQVSVVTEPIERMTEDGLVTRDGAHHPLDTVIYATGFESLSFLAPIEIEGSGARLHERWRDGAEAYLGMAVAGFPNLFILYGPNTNLGHSSIIFMIECQTRYVLELVRHLAAVGKSRIEVRESAERGFNDALQADLARTVWSAGCTNWYTTAAGRNTNNWASYTAAYWWRTRRPDPSAYHLG